MLSKLRKKSEGFTIIEVLIVLAIAGLILLIVFLAVPALQRNSRNTSRRNDVAALLGAYQEFVNNNGGVAPPDQVSGNCNTPADPCGRILALARRGIYTTNANFTITTITTNLTNNTTLDALPQVRFVKAAVCNTNGADADFSAGDRNVVILYSVEGSNNTPIRQCTSS